MHMSGLIVVIDDGVQHLLLRQWSHDCGQTPKAMTSMWTVPALILIDLVLVQADNIEEGKGVSVD